MSALASDNLRSVIKIFNTHPTILNYFRRRASNASAETFNSKVKIFRSLTTRISEREFIIFHLVKLYAQIIAV